MRTSTAFPSPKYFEPGPIKVRRSTFGNWFEFKVPEGTSCIILCDQGSQLIPKQILLPHQIYVRNVTDFKEVWALPVNHLNYIKVRGERVPRRKKGGKK